MKHDIITLLLPSIERRKGVLPVKEVLISFIITVVAGVVCHRINKWLDGDK